VEAACLDSKRYQKYRITLYYIVTALFWFSNYTYVPTFSPYLKTLGASMRMIGFIVGAYGLTQIILRVPIGIISDRLNKRKLFIVAGIFTSTLSALGLYFATSPATAFLFRALSGCAAATWVVFTVLFCSYFDDSEASRAIGLINSLTFFGQMSAMLIGGMIAESFGMRAPFLLAFAGGGLSFLCSLWLVEDKPVERPPMSVKDLLSVASDRNLMIVSSLAVIVQIISFGTTYGFTPILAKNIGATSFQLGLLTSLTTLPMSFSSALSGAFFAKRLGERKTIVFGFVLFSASVGIMPLIRTIPMLYLVQVVGGFGRGLVFPTLMALSIKTVDAARRASAMGFFQAIYGIGMTLGPIIVGYLSDSIGLGNAFYVTAVIGLLGTLGSLTMISDSRRK
jgi:MFS family permease